MGEMGEKISTPVDERSTELSPGGFKGVLLDGLADQERKLAELSKGHENFTPLPEFEKPTVTKPQQFEEPTTSNIEALNRQLQAISQMAGGRNEVSGQPEGQGAEEALAARMMAEQLQSKPKNLLQRFAEFIKNFFRRLFFIK